MFSLHHKINPHKNIFFYLTTQNKTLKSITNQFNNNTYYNT